MIINNKYLKNVFSGLVAVCMFAQSNIFAATSVISNTYNLADGIIFTDEELVDSSDNRHKAYVLEYTPGAESSTMEFLYGSNLNTRTTVTDLVENNTFSEGNAVAAMNADFFNMSTGLAESIVVKDGILLTSDRDNYAFSFDSEGKPFIDKPAVSMILDTPYKQYTVLHYNKEFTEYGLYLYSPAYGVETRISSPSVELVLVPFSEALSYEGISALMYGEEGIPFDLELKKENEDGETEIVINERYKSTIEAYAFEHGYILEGMTFYMVAPAEITLEKKCSAFVKEIRHNEDERSQDIPEGCFVLAADAETQSFKLENVVEGDKIDITFNCNERFIGVNDAIGCGALIVENGSSVENTNMSHYLAANPRTAIGITAENKIIMFAVDGRQGSYSKGLTLEQLSEEMIRLGCVTAANLDGGGSTVVKATLPDTGKFTTVSSPSYGDERKVSNAIAFYNTAKPDGSKAYSYLDSEKRLVLSNSKLELGQAYFVDKSYYLSGASPIKKNESQQNKLNKENIVTDDVILNELLSSSVSSSNENEDKTERVEYDYCGFTYTVDEKKGVVEDGIYSPMGYAGDVYIISTSPDGTTNKAVRYTSLEDVDSIKVNSDRNTLYVGDVCDLSAQSYYMGYEVVGDDECFVWNSSGDSLTVDKKGVVTAQKAEDNVKISAKFGKTTGEYIFNVKDLPFGDISSNWAKESIIILYDKGISNGEMTSEGRYYFPSRTFTRTEFCVMLSRLLGLTTAVDAVSASEATQVLNPDATTETISDTTSDTTSYTASDTTTDTTSDTASDIITDATSDATSDTSSEVTNVSESAITPDYADFESIPEWAKESVTLLYKNGYLEGFEHEADGNKLFDGSSFVTRREVIRLIGRLLKTAPDDYHIKFSDIKDDDPDIDSIRRVLYNEIFNGYLDGTLRVDNKLTRAEVSAIFIRLSDIM